jgi:flagellar hook-associated protein 3 FlgL
MRVTENLRLLNINTTLGRLGERQAEASRQASSGIRLDQVSTDPLAADQSSRVQASLQQTQTFQKNIGFFRDNANKVENSLAQGMDLLARAREIALQGANDSMSSDNRASLAMEVAGIREQLIALANTKGTNGYLFSGQKTDTPAFDQAGVYQGNTGALNAEVAPGLTMEVNINGQDAFASSSGVNVFDELSTLEADLKTGTAVQVSPHLSGIDSSFAQLSNARSRSGLMMNRLDTASTSLEQGELALTKRQSSLVDADPIETISRLTSLNNTIQQAISVARTTLNQNLERF